MALRLQCPRCAYVFAAEAPRAGAHSLFCPRCGEVLPAERLADLAPRAEPRRREWKTRAAAILLFTAAGMGLALGLVGLRIEGISRDLANAYDGDVGLEGRVVDPELDALAGVTVAVEGRNESALSSGSGSWRLRLPAGVYELHFSKAGFRNVTMEVAAVPYAQPLRTTMHPGAGQERQEQFPRGATLTAVGITLVFALLALLGGVSAYRRRNWALALMGSIAGLFTLLGLPFSLAALVLVSLSRRAFAR